MSYRIEYGPAGKNPGIRKSKRVLFALLIVFVLLAAGVRIADSSGKLWYWLLPGDPAVTEAALLGLVSDIQSGETFPQAVVAFCRTVLNGAEIVC